MKKLCSNLAEGFHAAAQPLTILRSNLESFPSNRKSGSEFRELVTSSAEEVKQLCTLFSCMRELVIAESVKPELFATPILPLLERAIDGVSLLFLEDGILLRSTMPDTCQPVIIDHERTLEALTAVLLTARTMSRTQETVELIASSTSSKMVKLVLRNLKSYSRELNAEASLSMALAETNIRSQAARLSFSLQPFSVQIELRKAP